MSPATQGINLLKTLRNFAIANVFAVFPLLWTVLGWMPDQIKVRMRGWEDAPGAIMANGTALAGEEYGEWSGGRVFRFYLHSGMEWKDLVFRFPGTAGTEAVERIELQKWKLLSLGKKGGGLTERDHGTAEYIFATPRFESVGFAGGKVAWGLAALELLLAALSWWCARRHRGETWKTLVPSAIAVALALTSLTQLALPIQSFWANRASYPFLFGELAVAVAGRFAWISLLGIVSVTLLARCFGRWVFGVVLAMAVCIYLESGILSNGLAHLNGDIFLLQDRIRALWDVAVLVAVFVVIWAAHPLLRNHYALASLCLAAMVVASLFDTKHEQLGDKRNLIVHDFVPIETVIRSVTYSTNRNVMVFILDSLECEQAHAITEDPEASPQLREQFRGFIEYTNNVGALPQTLVAVPNLLTGCYPDNAVNMADYAWSCYGSESALRDFLETGYAVFLTTPGLACGYTTVTNEISVAASVPSKNVLDQTGSGGEVWSLRNVSRWRWMPFAGKAVCSALTGIANPSEELREWGVFSILAKAPIDADLLAAFLLVHTEGVHVPIRWSRKGEVLPPGDDNEQRSEDQGVFILGHLGHLLDCFRNAGIYDQSMILVLGDHGNHDERRFSLDREQGRLPGSARPCLWIKPMGCTDKFHASDIPTSHSRVAALLKASAQRELSQKDIASILHTDQRIYRRMPLLGDGWTDWVVGADGRFSIEEHVQVRGKTRPVECGRRYSLCWNQIKTIDADFAFRNLGVDAWPYLPRNTREASVEFCVPDFRRRYVLRLELGDAEGGSLRCRCDVPGAEWEEFPVRPHGKIIARGVTADSSGTARVLLERGGVGRPLTWASQASCWKRRSENRFMVPPIKTPIKGGMNPC